jgi:hypothetical protein
MRQERPFRVASTMFRPDLPRNRLFIRHESAHGPAMANHIRLHSVEIVFYSAASFLVVAGMVLLFLR